MNQSTENVCIFPKVVSCYNSCSLKELANSPLDQSRLQAVLSLLRSKSDVLSLLQETKALSEVTISITEWYIYNYLSKLP